MLKNIKFDNLYMGQVFASDYFSLSFKYITYLQCFRYTTK